MMTRSPDFYLIVLVMDYVILLGACVGLHISWVHQ
jgi:hypothetical protein